MSRAIVVDCMCCALRELRKWGEQIARSIFMYLHRGGLECRWTLNNHLSHFKCPMFPVSAVYPSHWCDHNFHKNDVIWHRIAFQVEHLRLSFTNPMPPWSLARTAEKMIASFSLRKGVQGAILRCPQKTRTDAWISPKYLLCMLI